MRPLRYLSEGLTKLAPQDHTLTLVPVTAEIVIAMMAGHSITIEIAAIAVMAHHPVTIAAAEIAAIAVVAIIKMSGSVTRSTRGAMHAAVPLHFMPGRALRHTANFALCEGDAGGADQQPDRQCCERKFFHDVFLFTARLARNHP